MSSIRSRSGGSDDRENRQAIIKVLAKRSLLDGLFQIDVRRGNDADVGLDHAACRRRG